jgi:hypothetical protein
MAGTPSRVTRLAETHGDADEATEDALHGGTAVRTRRLLWMQVQLSLGQINKRR